MCVQVGNLIDTSSKSEDELANQLAALAAGLLSAIASIMYV